MNKQNKSNYHHGDLRSALIHATIEMIEQQGVDKITMRSLSDWVGVSRTAAYRHFSDKSDLLTATAIEGFKQFSHVLSLARNDRTMSEIDRFRLMGKAYISFASKNSAYYRLMFSHSAVQLNKPLQTGCDSAFNELLLMLEELQKCQLISNDDAHLQAVYIWSLMHGLASLLIDNKLQSDTNMDHLMQFIDQSIAKSLNKSD